MGITLLAVTLSWSFLWVIIQVAIGLGAVIFVHELGHFLVAKACGVKCDKFFIGFDIGGIKLSRQWGETEYGIGILPLGGYVKMLGQDDNPAKVAEEMERARIPRETRTADGDTDDGYQLDPRSYLAKSVPQRMAIISAGVVMNVIFAVVFAMIAYGMGVKYRPCIISDVMPGSPAWRANLQVGDEIVRIGDVERPRFRDLQSDVSLGDPTRGIPIQIKRPGVEDIVALTIQPDRTTALPTIGVISPRSLTLVPEEPTIPGSPAAETDPPLVAGDRIIAVDGQPVAVYYDLVCLLAANTDEQLEVTVRRQSESAQKGSQSSARDVTVQIAPNPVKQLGLAMQYGPIKAVQADSPAARAGVKPGDTILAIDGQDPGDPLTLAQRLDQRASAGVSVRLTLGDPKAGAAATSSEVDVVLRARCESAPPLTPDAPLAIPSLGIAFDILNRVARVVPDSAAAERGIAAGDSILKAQLVPAPDDTSLQAELLADMPPMELGEDQPGWPALMYILQTMPPKVTVRLTVQNGSDAPREIELAPVASTQWFSPDRGLVTGPLEEIRKAGSVGDAFVLGARETKDALLMVYRFLKRLVEQRISPRMMGGPVTIAKVAGHSASAGFASLLIFLTMLSANLAVINFLPIPLLDGGHMVLLLIEGIMRRPVSERIVVALHTLGFVFIIGLMLFVLALDVGLIPRGL